MSFLNYIPKPIQALEEEAVLLALRKLMKTTHQNVAQLARDISEDLEYAQWQFLDHMRLNKKQQNDFIKIIENPDSRAVYSALKAIVEGAIPREPKLKMLRYYASINEELSELVDDFYEGLVIKTQHPEVFALRQQFNDHAPTLSKFIQSMQGRYVLYRPYYFDYEKQVMRFLLTIGADDNPYYASLHHKYDATKYKRGPEDYTFEGWVAPLPERRRAVINVLFEETDKRKASEEKEGNQMFYMDSVSRSGDKVATMAGVCLAIIGSSSPTAWPFYIERLPDDEEFEPDVVSRDHHSITADVEGKLRLGAVKWKGIY